MVNENRANGRDFHSPTNVLVVARKDSPNMALRIALQKKLNKDRNQDEIIGCDTFTDSIRATRSRSRSSSTAHKDAAQKFVSGRPQVESRDINSDAVETRLAKQLRDKVLQEFSDPTRSSPGTTFYHSTPPVKFHADEPSEPVLHRTKESLSLHPYTDPVYTPSPKGILKLFPTGVTPSPSPKAKSISFGGTFFSPTPSTPAQRSYKASSQLNTDTESPGIRSLRRKCRDPDFPSPYTRTLQDPIKIKDNDEESLKTVRRRNKKENASSLETSISDKLCPKLDTPTKAYSTKRTTSGGCSCKGFCNPSICSCAQNEIFCMVENQGFPCGCTETGCGNQYGRRQYDASRIHTHFQATIQRIQQDNHS